jgi:signal transduction histidine kinase
VAASASSTLDRGSRQSIALRLGLALGAIVVVLGLVSTACLWALVDIHERLHSVKEDEEEARRIVKLASAIRDQYAHVAHTIIIGNDTHAEMFRAASATVLALAEAAKSQARFAAGLERVDRIVKASREISSLYDSQILPAVERGDHAAAAVAHDRVLALALQSQGDADALAGRAEAAMEDLNKHVRATQHGAILLTIVAHFVALVTAVLIGLYLYRSIARPIAALASAATRLGAGDLEVRVTIERDDELGRLGQRFNEMARALRDNQAALLRSETLVGLGRVAAGIAHELNNPVGVVLGYAKLLLRREGPVDRDVLKAIEEEAERCHQVIDGLLELTRGSAVQLAPVALRPLVEDVVRRLRVAGVDPRVKISVYGEADVSADETKLRQVVTNLVQNALDAAGPNGSVTVVIDVATSGAVSLTVRDTGPGVREEDRSNIFEPFFTRKPNGTGLGLAIARAIARAHGGDVDLMPSRDGGAVFRLSLPPPKKKDVS